MNNKYDFRVMAKTLMELINVIKLSQKADIPKDKLIIMIDEDIFPEFFTPMIHRLKMDEDKNRVYFYDVLVAPAENLDNSVELHTVANTWLIDKRL